MKYGRKCNFFDAKPPHQWFYCSGLYRALLNSEPAPDIIHAHMLWDYSTFAAWRVAKKKAIPFVVTPHGTINESWRQSGLHKKLYNRNCLFIEHLCHRSKKPPQNERYCLALSAFYTILPKNMANRVKIFIDRKVDNLI
jgi:glycosyltransferase involved in cell wall biosynthesis